MAKARPNVSCEICTEPVYRSPKRLKELTYIICSSTVCRSEMMRRRWVDNSDKIRMKNGRWGENHVPQSHEERKRGMRDRALVRKFGITREEFNEILVRQGGVCAVCLKECKSGRALAVDHNHATGNVRGLLCADCNRALGLLKDDADRLIRAAEYVL